MTFPTFALYVVPYAFSGPIHSALGISVRDYTGVRPANLLSYCFGAVDAAVNARCALLLGGFVGPRAMSRGANALILKAGAALSAHRARDRRERELGEARVREVLLNVS